MFWSCRRLEHALDERRVAVLDDLADTAVARGAPRCRGGPERRAPSPYRDLGAIQPIRWRWLRRYVGLQAKEPAQAGECIQGHALAGAPGASVSGYSTMGGSLALRNPSNTEVAEALNLRTATASEEVCDVVVVGGG